MAAGAIRGATGVSRGVVCETTSDSIPLATFAGTAGRSSYCIQADAVGSRNTPGSGSTSDYPRLDYEDGEKLHPEWVDRRV